MNTVFVSWYITYRILWGMWIIMKILWYRNEGQENVYGMTNTINIIYYFGDIQSGIYSEDCYKRKKAIITEPIIYFLAGT